MLREFDLELGDGRMLHAYDSGGDGFPVFWQHGSPQAGAPPEVFLADGRPDTVRWLSHDRPGYAGSTGQPGRQVASAVVEVTALADELGIERFGVLGLSGGGPHALACAALLPERVVAAACVASLAPFEADGLDWYAGMAASGIAEFRAAVDGREALRQHLIGMRQDDPAVFGPADRAALTGPHGHWLADTVQRALSGGLAGYLDDELAFVQPWGCSPESIKTPTLFVHGGADRLVPPSHAQWLVEHCPGGQLWLRPDDGHLSIIDQCAPAADWLAARAT